MKKKQFKSESKKILDLMINSIYTNKEIFLRELISNASDAIDKLYYKSLTESNIKIKRSDLSINIEIDKDNRILKIVDNGIGMTEEELDQNLGTIARSGSLTFKETEEDKKKVMDIIGQFGVGFYSAFMVSKKIEVETKSVYSKESFIWKSNGEEGYTIEKSNKEDNGTIIKLHLKDNDSDNNYDTYLEEETIRELIKKYSDYIKYPIIINNETINSMIPLWKKNKNNIKEEEYNNFYSDKFNDYEKPLKVIHSKTEGLTSYDSLLFIPSHQPFNFYTNEYEKGLSLYSNGVLIMDKCKELIPDYLSFIKGIVDTPDLSLNISREMLQQTKTVVTIAKSIETKILKELTKMLNDEREEYNKFYEIFGIQLKFGAYNNYGLDKDKVKDLLMFKTSNSKEYKTIKEYISKMPEDQKDIYYVSGETYDKIDSLPLVDKVKDKGYEIIYLTDYVDEFTIQALHEYDNYKFININSEKLDIDTDEDKENINKINTDNKELLEFIKTNTDISEAKFTTNLKNHPVCLTSKGEISTEMEKVLKQMPIDSNIKAEKVLEINYNHPISKKIIELYKKDKEEAKKLSKVLYEQARLIDGLSIDNPSELSNIICELLSK